MCTCSTPKRVHVDLNFICACVMYIIFCKFNIKLVHYVNIGALMQILLWIYKVYTQSSSLHADSFLEMKSTRQKSQEIKGTIYSIYLRDVEEFSIPIFWSWTIKCCQFIVSICFFADINVYWILPIHINCLMFCSTNLKNVLHEFVDDSGDVVE